LFKVEMDGKGTQEGDNGTTGIKERNEGVRSEDTKEIIPR
jgi:hypothetical protein